MTEEIRSKGEILNVLSERKAAFKRLSQEEKRSVDAERFVPTMELHSLLDFYLFHGFCEDEFPSGRLLTNGKQTKE